MSSKPFKLAEANKLALSKRLLTKEEFQGLATVPPEIEWFANIDNGNTRRAYQNDVKSFMTFVGIAEPEEFRIVTRSHVIAWRKTLKAGELGAATIRRKLSALSSLFEYLCEANAVVTNPVAGVKRPSEGANEGKTPALSDLQARQLLEIPPENTLIGKRDRAILAVFLFHGLRRDELCGLRIADLQARRGVPHLQVKGKRSKIRYLPLHPRAQELIETYLDATDHRDNGKAFLFRPVKGPHKDKPTHGLHAETIYVCVVMKWAGKAGIAVNGFSPHSLRATAATNALEHDADLAKVQEWLGHSSIATTRLYDKRNSRIEDSPTFRVTY